MKPASYYQGKEQTYLKHFFLERYLETVAFHIGYHHPEFVYVDGFSGPWRSADEELADTSIRIALDKLNYVREGLAAKQRYPKMRAVFIEKGAEAFGTLQSTLEHHKGAVNATAILGSFEENIPEILRVVGAAFALFFIDPKGWTGFAMDRIAPVLNHERGEVIVNFMYDYINRFINSPSSSNESSLNRLFGTTAWRSIRESPDRETASVDCYREQIRTVGSFPYVTSTRILKPVSDRAYFHLIYATRSARGIFEFREVERRAFKEQDAVRAIAQRDHREARTGQAELPFESPSSISRTALEDRERRLREARARLFAILQNGPLLYQHLEPQILEIPLVWYADLKQLLIQEQKAGRLLIKGMVPRQRSPKPGCLIQSSTYPYHD